MSAVTSCAPTTPRRQSALALLLLLPVPSLGVAASMFWWPGSALGQSLFLASKLWIVLLPVVWLHFVRRERPGWSPARRGGFGVAAGLGVGIALAIVAVYALVRQQGWIDPGQVAQRAAATGLNQVPLYLGGAVYWIVVNSLLEEYVWRWFVFREFEVLVGGPAAVGAAALGFTAHHVVALAGQFPWPVTLAASAGVCVGGVAWSWLYLRYRSIWPGYLSHAIVDVPIFAIGYVLIFR